MANFKEVFGMLPTCIYYYEVLYTCLP